jgi:hypothetical protein
MAHPPEPQWQPIGRLPLIAHAIDGMLEAAEEQHSLLEQARPRSHLLDDATVARVTAVFTQQSDDLWLYEEQLRRWRDTELTATERGEVERLSGRIERLRTALTEILSLAEELKHGTLEQVLAKNDIELAMEWLSGQRQL